MPAVSVFYEAGWIGGKPPSRTRESRFVCRPPRALQRFYEPREHPTTKEVIHEDRYLNAIWPQVSQIHDLHFDPTRGSFFTVGNPLTVETRFGPKKTRKKKMPQV